MSDFNAKDYFSKKAESYKDTEDNKKWFSKNYELFNQQKTPLLCGVF